MIHVNYQALFGIKFKTCRLLQFDGSLSVKRYIKFILALHLHVHAKTRHVVVTINVYADPIASEATS